MVLLKKDKMTVLKIQDYSKCIDVGDVEALEE